MTARPPVQRAVAVGDGGAALVTRPLRDPGPEEVLLRLVSIGVCSSDVHIWAGRKAGTPGILGHEGAGVVAAVGPDVRAWAPGDAAVVYPVLGCRACARCRDGDDYLCEAREIVGYNGRGIMADFQLCEARTLVRPPAALALEHGCLVEPLACVVHAQDRLGGAVESSLVIVGAGPMGSMHAAYARHRGVKDIWLLDRDRGRLALAERRGIPATAFVAVDEDLLARGLRAEVVITANSVRSGHDLAVALTAPGGTLLAFSSVLDRPGPLRIGGHDVDVDDIHRREDTVRVGDAADAPTVVGAIGADHASFDKAATLLTGTIDAAAFVTATLRLGDVPGVTDEAWRRQLKIVVRP